MAGLEIRPACRTAKFILMVYQVLSSELILEQWCCPINEEVDMVHQNPFASQIFNKCFIESTHSSLIMGKSIASYDIAAMLHFITRLEPNDGSEHSHTNIVVIGWWNLHSLLADIVLTEIFLYDNVTIIKLLHAQLQVHRILCFATHNIIFSYCTPVQ